MKLPKYIRKRDGSLSSFDKKYISSAINKAFLEANEGNPILALKITETILVEIARTFPSNRVPSVEDIQDIVENNLIKANLPAAAKKYILYRNKRSLLRV